MSFELILPFLRPIEPLLLDEEVSEIMGNPDSTWWYEREGTAAAGNRALPSTPAVCAPASKSSPTSSANGSTKTIRCSTRSFPTAAASRR